MTAAAALGGRASLHATAIIYGESGILILGPSGSGKSALALALMARANATGAFSALVGDDRISVIQAHDRLVAHDATRMAGVIERRAMGLISVRHEPATVVRLAVELCERWRRWPRMPDEGSLIVDEVTLPHLALDSDQSACDQAVVIDERLATLGPRAQRVQEFRLNIPPQCTKMGALDIYRSICAPEREPIK